MAISKSILGMNARNFLYIRLNNNLEAKNLADDKLETKKLLLKHDISTPPPIKIFNTRDDVRKFHWNLPENGFAVKPSRGYGGAGIIVFKQWGDRMGFTTNNESYNMQKLESHIFDILDGAFSLQYLPDKAYIEDLVEPDPFFKKIAPTGLADVRIIVFHNIPIMAMIRIPTKESGGKANLQLGAIAVGIDMRTGITTHAIYHKNLISRVPNTKIKITGTKIPSWDKMLLLAAKTQRVSGLGFAGIDIVVDAQKGPMVLEINARPGLKIQNANLASLRTRLERVEDVHVSTPERGVEVAKSLFAEEFYEKININQTVLPFLFPVTIKSPVGAKTIDAKLDTGAYRTSIDIGLAKKLHLPFNKEKIHVKSASGKTYRSTITLSFEIANKKITTIASVVDRSHMKYQMIVGRNDLKGFLISSESEQEEGDELSHMDEREE